MMWVAVALSLVAVAYNQAANSWKPFHGWVYVPVNIAFAGILTIVAATTMELSTGELGLRGDLGDVVLPLALVAMVGAGAFLIAHSKHGHRIADARVDGLRGRALAFYVLVRIPLGTAVVEETIFRAVLFAAWRDAAASMTEAAVWASAAFGLWHVSPTIIGVQMNDPSASRRKVGAAVVGSVVATTAIGLGLTWLRIESGSLLAPIVLHAGVNSVSALAAVKAGRIQHGDR